MIKAILLKEKILRRRHIRTIAKGILMIVPFYMEKEYKYADITKKIIGAAFEVHGVLKNGFVETVYHRALAIELATAQLDFTQEYEMPIYYKNQKVGMRRVDFFVQKVIPIEIKAVSQLEDVHVAQALNYLEAFNLEVGLLINFGAKSLEVRRLYNTKYKQPV